MEQSVFTALPAPCVSAAHSVVIGVNSPLASMNPANEPASPGNSSRTALSKTRSTSEDPSVIAVVTVAIDPSLVGTATVPVETTVGARTTPSQGPDGVTVVSASNRTFVPLLDVNVV